LGNDEHPTTPLRKSIIRSVHDAPFHEVTQRVQTPENHCEISTPLLRRGLEKPIDVLEDDVRGSLQFKEFVDLPPQGTFRPLYSGCLTENLCNRIVLARKATNKQIEIRDFALAFLCRADNLGYVSAIVSLVSEIPHVTI
jgi:hypothetical protein